MDVWGNGKRLWVTDASMNVTVIGNFGVDSLNSMMPGFQNTGEWYDYLSGDTINVTDVNAPIPLAAGEFHVFTNVKLTVPDLSVDVQKVFGEHENTISATAAPVPFVSEVSISAELPLDDNLKISVYDVSGNLIKVLVNEFQNAGPYNIRWNGEALPEGVYFYKIEQGSFSSVNSIIKIN